MAMTIHFSLLLFYFLITIPFHIPTSASPQNNSSEANSYSNRNLGLESKANNNGGATSSKLWCVAKNNAEDAKLQTALDWACGPGGADCKPIQQGGQCYEPNNIQAAASYAFNDYYLKNSMTQQSCSFDNTAALTNLNPSHGNCVFPSSSAAVVNGSFSGSAVGMGPIGADLSGSQIVGGALIAVPLIFATIIMIFQ